MEQNTNHLDPTLEAAWRRYAQLEAAWQARAERQASLYGWVAILGLVAALLAILMDFSSLRFPANGYGWMIKFILVLTPVVSAVLAAFVSRSSSEHDGLTLHAGAELILREIYLYRSIRATLQDRSDSLRIRLSSIDRELTQSLGRPVVLRDTKGPLPPAYEPQNEDSDPGFQNLTFDEYKRFRLEFQLAWHIQRVLQVRNQKSHVRLSILGIGATSAILAGLGGQLSAWVALTISLVSAILVWERLRNLESIERNYNQVILGLNSLRDHCLGLAPAAKTEAEYFHLVHDTEEFLWSQNAEFLKALPEALVAAEAENRDLVSQLVQLSQAVGSAGQATDAVAQLELQTMAFADESTPPASSQQNKSFLPTLQNIAEQYSQLELTKETPKEVLNQVIAQFPTSGEIKG